MISDRAIDRLREAAAWPELDARYEITGVAGYGGMGTVYIAHDHTLDRDVAVKVLDVADRQGSRAARLRREAHILRASIILPSFRSTMQAAWTMAGFFM
jgi:serine/threonine protein kinase